MFSDLSINDIKANLTGEMGREIFFYETVGSTNALAAEISRKTVEGTVVIADSQQSGRGRLGRTWVSPPGVNIYMSIIIKPAIPPDDATLLTLMTAIACATALRKATGLDVSIKWPNDLVVSDKKLGGILTEVRIDRKIRSAVIGIGINVNADMDVFPEEVREIATSLMNETGITYPRARIISEILNEMDIWYRTLKNSGGKKILSEWKRLTSTLGKQVMVTVGQETFRGVAESVDDKGMLVLRLDSGEPKRISAGDLTVLR